MAIFDDNLTFRVISPSDIERIVMMINRDPFHLKNGVSVVQFQQDIDDPEFKTRENTYVVELGPVTVGYFSLSLDERQKQINADCFGTVDCDWRRNGIGTAMFKFIFIRLQEIARKEKKIVWFTHRAVTRIPGETQIGEIFGMQVQSTLEILRLNQIDKVALSKVIRPSGIGFRTPTLNDADDWAEIFNEAFGSNLSAESIVQQFKGPYFSPQFYILSFDKTGKTVGIIRATINEAVAQIPTLAIRRKFQGQGVGKALLAEEIIRLGNFGISDIRLTVDSTNVSAKSLYKKLGFQLEYKRINYFIEFTP